MRWEDSTAHDQGVDIDVAISIGLIALTATTGPVGAGTAVAVTSRSKAAREVASTALALIPAPFRLPVRGRAQVVNVFDKPEKNWLRGHRGVDLAAPRPGVPVLAASNGKVYFSGSVAGKPTVSILHGKGIRTTYEPVKGTVDEGDTVVAGQVIGHLARTHGHCEPNSCLHWGAIKGGEYIDPLHLIGEVRLLPVK